MAKLIVDGYGQLELNQVAWPRDGRIEAQCALDPEQFNTDVTGDTKPYCENGMILVVDNVNRIISLTGDYASAIPQISTNSANITELSSKFEDCCSSVQDNINNLSSSITNISGDVINKLDRGEFDERIYF